MLDDAFAGLFDQAFVEDSIIEHKTNTDTSHVLLSSGSLESGLLEELARLRLASADAPEPILPSGPPTEYFLKLSL